MDANCQVARDSNRNLLTSCSFDDFWGFVWQLQVASFFVDQAGVTTEWTGAGPDLRVQSHAGEFFVECYTYRKSFGIKGFVEELLRQIHPRLRVWYVPCIQFTLPHGKRTEAFLEGLFAPYIDPGFLPEKLREAEEAYPVPVSYTHLTLPTIYSV